MTEEYAAARYEDACALLPARLRTGAALVEQAVKAETEELRLRIGRPLHLALQNGELPLPQTRIIRGDLEQVLDRATEYSRYTAAETLRQGYVTAAGGFRIGVCGTALPSGESNEGIRDVSSLSIRIPRVREGAARPVLPGILDGGRPLSTLLLSPPGGGKTTLLRDLVRLLSEGTDINPPCRVALVDERGELAAVHRGRPQLEVGCRTDVMDGCPKALAVPMLLRAMTPQVIALDEVALPADVTAVCAAANCGVTLLATVHAASLRDLQARQIGRALLECGVFRRAVVIEGMGMDRKCRAEPLP
ncbi:MAG: stage III sporulation protein AA [Oscillospiraceae bacterium]|nr:stage III sporulation protein AA [Oscillospiraceae bacterium]